MSIIAIGFVFLVYYAIYLIAKYIYDAIWTIIGTYKPVVKNEIHDDSQRSYVLELHYDGWDSDHCSTPMPSVRVFCKPSGVRQLYSKIMEERYPTQSK